MKICGNIIDIFKRKIYKGCLEIENNIIKDLYEEDNSEDRYLLPGLIDSHIHIESSMLIPSRFAEAAVKHGTVAVVSDPHEIANVMGAKGVEFMINNGHDVPLKFYFGAPSCVPATPFEMSGGKIGIEEIRELLGREEVRYLSEMMNFPGVINNQEEVIEKIRIAKKVNKPVDGHAPGLTGNKLDKYINAGISTDHESINLEEAREKIEKGMKIQIREGSAARGLEKMHYLIAEKPGRLMICSDDLHPEMLEKGHIDILVKRLIGYGYDIFDILKITVVNPVEHYGLDTGMLRKGDKADFIVIDNPEDFNVQETWINGKKIYDGKNILFEPPVVRPLNNFHSTPVKTDDIKVNKKSGKIRVINAVDGELVTGVYEWEIKETGGILHPDTEKDILKIVVKDRYKDSDPSVAFIKGFGLKKGAFASSIAHDSHNIVAVGADDKSICKAVNRVIAMTGGLVVCDQEKCTDIRLEVGGIMSDVPCGTMAGKYKKLTDLVRNMGCQLKSPFMTLSFMALLVIPELKLSDRGLFDVNRFEFVDLYI